MDERYAPQLNQLEAFLTVYGWHFQRETSPDGTERLIAPFPLNQEKGVLILFNIVGEFVCANTAGLLKDIPTQFAVNLLALNDSVKLVKIFAFPPERGSNFFDADLAFELWAESFNQGTFFAFMEMLCLGVEKTLDVIAQQNIPHQTSFVSFQ